MIRPSVMCLVIASLVGMNFVSETRGQGAKGAPAKKKGFDLAPKKKAKAVIPQIVNEEPDKPHLISRWNLNLTGEPGLGYVPTLETIETFSSGRMRWTFTVFNEGEHRNDIFFKFDKFTVSDEEGEVYALRGKQFPNDVREGFVRKQIPPRTKYRFWLDFDTPKQPVTKFQVVLDVSQSGTSFFAPINVPLTKAIGGDPEATAEADSKDMDSAGKTKERAKNTAAVPPKKKGPQPVGTEDEIQAFKAVYQEGKQFEGEVEDGGKLLGVATLIFEAVEDGNNLQAHISCKQIPDMESDLRGRIVADKVSPLKAAFMLIDDDGTSFHFILQGKDLEGTDSKSRKFLLKAE